MTTAIIDQQTAVEATAAFLREVEKNHNLTFSDKVWESLEAAKSGKRTGYTPLLDLPNHGLSPEAVMLKTWLGSGNPLAKFTALDPEATEKARRELIEFIGNS